MFDDKIVCIRYDVYKANKYKISAYKNYTGTYDIAIYDINGVRYDHKKFIEITTDSPLDMDLTNLVAPVLVTPVSRYFIEN